LAAEQIAAPVFAMLATNSDVALTAQATILALCWSGQKHCSSAVNDCLRKKYNKITMLELEIYLS